MRLKKYLLLLIGLVMLHVPINRPITREFIGLYCDIIFILQNAMGKNQALNYKKINKCKSIAILITVQAKAAEYKVKRMLRLFS